MIYRCRLIRGGLDTVNVLPNLHRSVILAIDALFLESTAVKSSAGCH